MDATRLPRARLEPPAVRAIARDRVDRLLDRAWHVALTVVVGPAGAGKSTAVAQFVQRSPRPAVWYRAHPVDSDPATFAAHLGAAITHRTGVPCELGDLTQLALHVERTAGEQPLLVVIDELDAVIGTETERALARSLGDAPPRLHVVTLSRHRPAFNLGRLRLTEDVCEIGPDDLRFRSWEVDRLFRELYGRPLPPDEVVELERRTGGWVAAMQLFNLATARLPAFERRRAIAHVGRRAGPDWDFLAENVLSGLSDELQGFLFDTVPFERLTADLCDDLRSSSDSWRHLDELDRLQLVTSSMEAPGSFRLHEVLRAHVEAMLREVEGVDSVHKRYRCAGEALEHRDQVAEALLSFCRGEDWVAVSRLLGARGDEVAARPGSWLLGVPESIVRSDPWLVLAVARQQRGDGRIVEAITTFERVEQTSLTSAPAVIARRERLLLASLVDRSSRPSLAWVAALREAAIGDPVAAVSTLTTRTAHDLAAIGIAKLVAADVAGASDALRRARDVADSSPTVALAARVALLVAEHLAGRARPVDADDLERAAAVADVPFLTRLARAAGGVVTGSVEQISAAIGDCDLVGDELGGALAAAMRTVAMVWNDSVVTADLDDAAARCERIGSPSLHLWVLAFGALRPWPGRDVDALEGRVRRRGSRPIGDVVRFAAMVRDQPGSSGGEAAGFAERMRVDHGIVVPRSVVDVHGRRSYATGEVAVDPVAVGPAAGPRLVVRCFGAFEMRIDDRPVDLSALRPRARAVLRLLALRGGGVNRATLVEELWPDDAEATGTPKLHVAISALRRVIEGHGLTDVVRRHGDLYVLAPELVWTDVGSFDAELVVARQALAGEDDGTAARALRNALDLRRGELLAEDGAADWVITTRRTIDSAATWASEQLALLLLRTGDPGSAVEVCRAGLRFDRFCDPLWRTLLKALELADDHAGRALAVTQYEAVLAELGVVASAP